MPRQDMYHGVNGLRRRDAWLVAAAALAILVATTSLLYAVHIPGDVRGWVPWLHVAAAAFAFIALAVSSRELLRVPEWFPPWQPAIGVIALALAVPTVLCGVLASAYAAADEQAAVGRLPQPVPVAVGDGGRPCGKDRWDVKTLSDPDAGAVNLHAEDTTVAELGEQPKPGVPIGGKLARLPAEHQTYTVRAELVFAARSRGDRDIHLVVADFEHPTRTMVVEMPDPECKGARQSPELGEMSAARASFIERCGLPPKGDFRKLDGAATITGVAFFDRIHGKNRPRGRAPNGIELHPILGFRDVHCK